MDAVSEPAPKKDMSESERKYAPEEVPEPATPNPEPEISTRMEQAVRARYEKAREEVRTGTREKLAGLRAEMGGLGSEITADPESAEPFDFAAHEAFLRSFAESGNWEDRAVVRDVWTELNLIRNVLETEFDPSVRSAFSDRAALREYRDFLVSHESEFLALPKTGDVRLLRLGWEGTTGISDYGETYVANVRSAEYGMPEGSADGGSERRGSETSEGFGGPGEFPASGAGFTEKDGPSDAWDAESERHKETALRKLPELVDDPETAETVREALEAVAIVGADAFEDVHWLGFFRMLAKLAVRDGMRGFRRRRYRIRASREAGSGEGSGMESGSEGTVRSDEISLDLDALERITALSERVLEAIKNGSVGALSAGDKAALARNLSSEALVALGINPAVVAEIIGAEPMTYAPDPEGGSPA